MSKHVAIIGMLGWHELPDADERWGLNYSFQRYPNLTRLYFFDHPDHFDDLFVELVSQLTIPVITTRPYPAIPTSQAYPIDNVVHRFGTDFFTCTSAYMLAHAIFEKADVISIVGMYDKDESVEYFHHVACMNLWLGVALGRGITVHLPENCALGKPFPWQTRRYGWEKQLYEPLAQRTLSSAYRACKDYPREFIDTRNETPEQMAAWKRQSNLILVDAAQARIPKEALAWSH